MITPNDNPLIIIAVVNTGVISLDWFYESMTTHRQTTGRHDNSATTPFHRQPTRRHDHWPTRQVTDIFFKNSPPLADTHRQRLS